MGADEIFLIVAAFVLGLIFGSFATVVAHRLPRGEGVAAGRSRCPRCGRTIGAIENIPVVSYIWLRGRCRHCGEPISIRYPVMEMATGVLFALSAWKFGVSVEAVAFAGLFWGLVVLTVIDIDHHLLPDKIVWPLLVVGWVTLVIAALVDGDTGRWSGASIYGAALSAVLLGLFVPWGGKSDETDSAVDERRVRREFVIARVAGLAVFVAWIGLLFAVLVSGRVESVAGGLVGMATFAGLFAALVLVYSKGMGGGDVKLGLVLGAFLGYLGGAALTLTGMFLSFLFGGIGSVAVLIRGGNRKTPIPFGPWLVLGTIVAVFWGERILDAYLGRF